VPLHVGIALEMAQITKTKRKRGVDSFDKYIKNKTPPPSGGGFF